MNEESNIITIRKVDINKADDCFAKLMSKTEMILNQKALVHVDQYKNLTPSALETVSKETIQLACQDTPFNPDNVILVSGHKFPDIVADGFYGVEVKSTNKDHWTSTGSSIVESTRIDTVENIYMLFGKLGGTPAEFRCRPYQDVMCDIAVTHSPRYLIDMTLEKGETIFDKLNYPYDKLRTSPEAIDKVKQYYKNKAKKQGDQMPWWIDDSDTDPIGMNVRLWNSLPVIERNHLKAQMLVLYPEIVNSNYGNAAMWLASAKGVVNPSFRDIISAGGRIYTLDGRYIENGIPKVWKTLAQIFPLIKEYLKNDTVIYPYIKEYNPDIISDNMLNKWIEQVERIIPPVIVGNKRYSFLELMDLLYSE